MKSAAFLAVLFASLPTIACAELPVMDEQPFIGKFLAYEDRKMVFTMTQALNAVIVLPESKGKKMSWGTEPTIVFRVEETMPDGKVTTRQIKQESLTTEQPAALNFQKTTVRGKTTGDAEFEVVIEVSRGAVMLGARIINPGTLKGALSMVIALRVGELYKHVKEENRKDRDFAKKIKRDMVEFTTMDRQRLKFSMVETQDLGAAVGNQVVMEFDAWKGRGLQMNASPNSSLALKDSGKPLLDGFEIQWKADPAKDPNGEARLALMPR